MIKSATLFYKIPHDDNLIDIISTISNFSCISGEIIGPIISGTLGQAFGFCKSSEIIGFCLLGFSVIYFFSMRLKSSKNDQYNDTICELGNSDRSVVLLNNQ